MPVMYTLRLLIVLTLTETTGDSTKRAAASAMRTLNASGVSPDACTSFSSGNVILPSGLTATSADRSFSRQ